VGYGQKPQISFPGAVTGRLRPYKTWRPIEQATMAYGYGLSASLLQMARAYTTFARDGEVIPVTMLRQEQPVSGIRVISPETAREIRTMLQMAAAPGGTGQLAQTIGYSVGGKSGTAHKQEGKGYATNKYRSWFVGLAPIDKPRIVVAVMVDEPSNGKYYGGAVAAPVFSQVVQQTLRMMGVPPDLDVKPQRGGQGRARRAGELLSHGADAALRCAGPTGWRRWCVRRACRCCAPTAAACAGDAFIAWPGLPPTAGSTWPARWRRRRGLPGGGRRRGRLRLRARTTPASPRCPA
jgi:membrane peptidoglycan carboxypeptidase